MTMREKTVTFLFVALARNCTAYSVQGHASVGFDTFRLHSRPYPLVRRHQCKANFSCELIQLTRIRNARPSPALLAKVAGENDDLCDIKKQTTGQAILSLAVPALAGLAIDPLMTIADTAFIGRTAVSADALGGVASSAALLSFSFYIFNFLCTATTPLVASRRASGDEEGALAVGGQA